MAACPMASLNLSVIKGDGVSSVSFWCLLWMEQSRSERWQAFPYWSPITCISICRGSSMSFSMYIPPFPKAASASLTAPLKFFSRSSSFQIARIPLPPPPAVALIITGYPIFSATFLASFRSFRIPSDPGMVGPPAFLMVALAEALSPILSIWSPVAPMNLISCSAQIRENLEI